MGHKSGNTFSRALHHLKSTQIDEKISLLNETPTNNTSNLYALEPDRIEVDPNGSTTPPDFTADDPELNGRDTSGLFESDGTIKVIEPPGDTSYILGPMSEMWYAWGNFTQIGYIRQSDRKMVNLARITGPIDSWDGTSNFTSYGQLTLEQAQWFKDTYRITYRAFYPGPPSNVPDEYGRYNCTTTGTPKGPKEVRVPGAKGGPEQAGFPWGILGKVGDTIKDLLGVPDAIKDIANVLKNAPEVINDIVKAIDELTQIDEYVEQTFGKLGNNVAIAVSNLTNRPVNITQDQISPSVIQDFANRLTPDLIGNDIPVNSGVVPYIDDNIRVDPRTGRVEPNTWDPSMPWSKDLGGLGSNTAQVDPAVKNPGSGPVNPITTAGQAQVQIVVPKDGSPPYLKYVDHAYANSKSTDANEFPGATETIYNIVNSIGDILHRKDNKNPSGVNSNMPNYGGMAGYPPNIRGDAVTTFDIPIANLPVNVQREINNRINSGNFNNSTFGDYSDFFNSTKAFTARSTGGFKSVKEETKLKRIIREVKKPVVIKEVQQERIKRRPKVIGAPPKTINSDLMKQAEVPTSFKPAEERVWGKYERRQNERMSQNKKNVVLDHLGASDHAWEYLLERNRSKDKYSGFFDKDGTPYTITRKEELNGENLLFIADETGKKETLMQSELNDKLDYEFNKELFEKYFSEQETLQADKEPLFKKVSKALKKEIDYADKPSKLGYPDENPPETINGYHPDLIDGEKISQRYNKLDPISANSMPPTGNPNIDSKVRKAKKLRSVKSVLPDS